jgi:hypothetical protein
MSNRYSLRKRPAQAKRYSLRTRPVKPQPESRKEKKRVYRLKNGLVSFKRTPEQLVAM